MDKTAAQLADALEDMHDFPHSTAGLAMLDEATGCLRDLSPEVAEAQQAFREARSQHKRSYRAGVGYSDDAWTVALAAADRLAAALRGVDHG